MARKQRRQVNRNWFKRVRGEFSAAIAPFVGQPFIYVEVGVWRGDSSEWVNEHALTHPDSWAFGIDPYLAGHNYNQQLADEVYQEVVAKYASWSKNQDDPKWQLIRGCSQDIFRDFGNLFSPRSIDFLYLDGAHDAHSVMLDFAYAWPHLKTGSVIQFDDWGIGHRKGDYHVPAAVDAILKSFGRFVETVGTPRLQYTLRVKEHPQLGAICK